MTGLLAHEWISSSGGSEKVLDRMAAVFPEAEIHCLWSDDNSRYEKRVIHETWLAGGPLRRHKALAVPASLLAWRLPRLTDYEWALISSHAFAHHLSVGGRSSDIKKLVYVHTPARYLWEPWLDRRGSHITTGMAGSLLRRLDRRRAQEAAALCTNSFFIRERIRRCWDRDAEVIHPPVDVALIQSVPDWRTRLTGEELAILEQLPSQFILGASRFVPYKRLDLVIDSGRLTGIPVVLAGSGQQEAFLRAKAASVDVPVSFVMNPSDPLLYALYQLALVFVFPAVEDFGIMPVEAMACGTPVVVNTSGGAVEGVHPPHGGAAVQDFTGTELVSGVECAARLDREGVGVNARRFSNARFDEQIGAWTATQLGWPEKSMGSCLT